MENLVLTPDEQKKKEILQVKLKEKIAEKSVDIKSAIEKIEKEGTLLHDYLVPTNKMIVELIDGNVKATQINGGEFDFSDFAIGQIAEKMHVPSRYLKDLFTGETWQRELAVKTVNDHVNNVDRDRLLIREVNSQIRGILSDSYRRLNSMQIYVAFLSACQKTGAVLIDAHSSDTRGYLEVVTPDIVSIPTKNNGIIHQVFGAQIRNSDFGAGALELKLYDMQVVCLNGMVSDSILREIHLGRRLPSDLRISKDTYIKDTQAMAGLVSDAMNQIFDPYYIAEKTKKIQAASEYEVDIEQEVKALPQIGFTQDETDAVQTVLINNDPEDGIQGSNTLWKFAQAAGAVARDSKNQERKRELQEIAGNLMARVK